MSTTEVEVISKPAAKVSSIEQSGICRLESDVEIENLGTLLTGDLPSSGPFHPETKKKKKKSQELTDEQIFDNEGIMGPELEEGLYMNKSFEHRIYLAIERFRKKCKFSQKQRSIFQDYLAFGKVITGQKDFIKSENIDPEVEMDQRVGMNEMFCIEDDLDVQYRVDFLFTIHQFLSNHFILNPKLVDLQSFKLAPKIIERFLKYLLAAEVCSEFTTDIKESLELCSIASTQLQSSKELSMLLPGTFNTACSLLFDGQYSWMKASSFCTDQLIKETIKINVSEALHIVSEHFESDATSVKKRHTRMIVQEVDTIENKAFLTEQPYSDYSFPFNDDEDETQNDPALSIPEHFLKLDKLEFYVSLEPELLAFALPRTVIEADFYKLSNDTWFFDNVRRVIPPFVSDNLPQ